MNLISDREISEIINGDVSELDLSDTDSDGEQELDLYNKFNYLVEEIEVFTNSYFWIGFYETSCSKFVIIFMQ